MRAGTLYRGKLADANFVAQQLVDYGDLAAEASFPARDAAE
jgi:hypothetical protein